MKDHPEAFTIWTVAEHVKHGYTVTTACTYCRKNLSELDLHDLIARGLGDKPLKQTGTKCPECNRPVHFTVRPPKGYGK